MSRFVYRNYNEKSTVKEYKSIVMITNTIKTKENKQMTSASR